MAAAAPSDARADDIGAVCHSEDGACRVDLAEAGAIVEFECTCADGSVSEGELEADPLGLAFACATSLGVCGEAPEAWVAADRTAPAEPEDPDDDAAAAGCTVDAPTSAWTGALLFPLLWRRRRSS